MWVGKIEDGGVRGGWDERIRTFVVWFDLNELLHDQTWGLQSRCSVQKSIKYTHL